MSDTIKVTLTMTKDTARSLLGIVEHAIAEGDRRVEDGEEFDKDALYHHEAFKRAVEVQVLGPIRESFPRHITKPEDLIGLEVTFPAESLGRDIRGRVTKMHENNTARVIVQSGASEFGVHWLQCRQVAE